MALSHIQLDQIAEAHLNALIVTGAAETRSIEYKRDTYGQTDRDYSEFLADVSSFANTSGGDLLIGVTATDGIPTSLAPLTISMDSEVLRLEQVARNGLQPRLAAVDFRPIPIQRGGAVLLIRIPRSFNPPHRIIRQNSNRFWARSAAGKYEPDVNELRSLFNSAPRLAERIRDFRLDRVAQIAAGRAPVTLLDKGILAIHIVPLSAFDAPPVLRLSALASDFNSFVPIGSHTASGARINYEGVIKTSNADQRATQHRAYTQLYRNGIVEAVASSQISEKIEAISHIDDKITSQVVSKLADLTALGVQPPFLVLVSLIGVAGTRFNSARGPNAVYYDNLSNQLERDQYLLDEVLFETIPATQEECAQAMRPILDQLANAGGNARSPVFDEHGRYISFNQA